MREGREKDIDDSTSTAPAPAPSRTSLKSDSAFNKYQLWKHKLRENCYKRLRDDRTRLLWKFRCNQQEDDVNMVKSAFQDIVSDEFRKIKASHDDLWDYEPSQCQDILIEMQTIFYQDLKSQPLIQDLESDIDTWEDEVDEYLARAVYEHMQLNADEVHVEEIWCPICKQGQLKENHNLIYCTCCELQLNKADELTLDFLRDRLAEVHMEHLDRGCRLKPKFCIKTKFNLTALYISCEACDTFEVVI
ncbi:hypothetical protein RJT34_08118 [Clitoria ternatea]|uniref:RPA-interacting protein n=1 Tax=Clitoria ternatea TaxID=43366 RepID=A0AAN9PVG3_CLITE